MVRWNRRSARLKARARLLVGLDQIYTHSIRHDLSGGSNYTVADRVERCVVRLKQYLERSGSPSPEGPDFVVMAGAGCHLPLARELLAKAFGKAELLFDLPHAKSKVAFGLIRYLDLRLFNEEAVRDVRPASDFSHADLSWRGGRIGKPILWVPSCSPLFKATSYHLPNRVLSEIWNNDRQILVLRDPGARARGDRLLRPQRGDPAGRTRSRVRLARRLEGQP